MNPLEFKHAIAGQPYRLARGGVGPIGAETTDGDVLTLSIGAAYTIAMNLAAPLSLINTGFRGNRYLSHIDFVRNSPYPIPLFNYVTPGSSAEKFGARLGGRIGGALYQGIMQATPGVGWLPVFEEGMLLGKLPLHSSIKKAGVKSGAKIGAKVGGRLIPGVGWALLAYDVYDIAANRSLWGFSLR